MIEIEYLKVKRKACTHRQALFLFSSRDGEKFDMIIYAQDESRSYFLSLFYTMFIFHLDTCNT